MSKSMELALLLALSLVTLALAQDPEAEQPTGNIEPTPETDDPCPVPACEGNCTYVCLRAGCPTDCVNEQGCDQLCKRPIIKQYLAKARQAYKSSKDGDAAARNRCVYEECRMEDGKCDHACIKNYCPEECMDAGGCDRACKFQKMMKAKLGLNGDRLSGMADKWSGMSNRLSGMGGLNGMGDGLSGMGDGLSGMADKLSGKGDRLSGMADRWAKMKNKMKKKHGGGL